MGLLTPQQEKVWTLRKLDRMGYSEVGRLLGLDRRTVYLVEKRVESKLRGLLSASGGAFRLLREGGTLPLEVCASCGATGGVREHVLRLSPEVSVPLCGRCRRLATEDEPNKPLSAALPPDRPEAWWTNWRGLSPTSRLEAATSILEEFVAQMRRRGLPDARLREILRASW